MARGCLESHIHTVAKPNAPETIPTFKLMLIADLLETLRTSPTSYSVIEYNGSNHASPPCTLLPQLPLRPLPWYAGGAIRFVDAPGAPEGGISSATCRQDGRLVPDS